MKRRHSAEEHENEERWLLTYADLITLLMAFFMIMYSLSRVDNQKFKSMANSLASVFPATKASFIPFQGQGGQKGSEPAASMRKNPEKPPDSAPGKGSGKAAGEGPQKGADQGAEKGADQGIEKGAESGAEQGLEKGAEKGAEQGAEKGAGQGPEGSGNGSGKGSERAAMEKLAHEFEELVRQEGLIGSVTIQPSPDGRKLMVRLSESLLFAAGRAELAKQSLPLIDKISSILATASKPVRVEGHTDNIPINNAFFHSNWELSTARAASVIRYMIDKHQFSPELLSASGYGEYRPVAPNDTPENRAKNRRVEFVITGHDEDA